MIALEEAFGEVGDGLGKKSQTKADGESFLARCDSILLLFSHLWNGRTENNGSYRFVSAKTSGETPWGARQRIDCCLTALQKFAALSSFTLCTGLLMWRTPAWHDAMCSVSRRSKQMLPISISSWSRMGTRIPSPANSSSDEFCYFEGHWFFCQSLLFPGYLSLCNPGRI